MQRSLRNVLSLANKLPLKTNGAILGAMNSRFYSSGEVDLVVIGAGPGGYVASIKAAQLGLKTVNVEKGTTLGGTCLNVGCIPSKALLNSSQLYEMAVHDGLKSRGIEVSGIKLNLEKLMEQKRKVVTALTGGIVQLFKKNKVERVMGTGTIKTPNSVEVTKADGSKDVINTKNIMIASGSVVTPFPGVQIDEEVIVSSDGALSLKRVPKTLLLIGCGIIGVEIASLWARLGSKVTALDVGDVIGGTYLDLDLVRAFRKQVEKIGVIFKLNASIKSIEKTGQVVKIQFDCAGATETFLADCVLVAVGRQPSLKNLGLENVNIAVNKRGRIQTNEKYQTSIPNIYAIGDCIEGKQLAHVAEMEAEQAVEGIVGKECFVNYEAMPSVFFSNPELAWMGGNEPYYQKKGIPLKIGKFPFSANARALTCSEGYGFIKVMCHEKTEELLAAHIIGECAHELINEFCILKQYGGTATDLSRVCHAHPTYAEAIKEACMLAATGQCINYG